MKNSFSLDPGKTQSNDCGTIESKDISFSLSPIVGTFCYVFYHKKLKSEKKTCFRALVQSVQCARIIMLQSKALLSAFWNHHWWDRLFFYVVAPNNLLLLNEITNFVLCSKYCLLCSLKKILRFHQSKGLDI